MATNKENLHVENGRAKGWKWSEEDKKNRYQPDNTERFKGNKYRLGISNTSNLIWETPEDFLQSLEEYIDFCKDNPILVEGIYGKDAVVKELRKHRITTITGFCVYMRMNIKSFYDYEQNSVFTEYIQYARMLFSNSNVELAAAFAISASIITRLEGLVDRRQVDNNNVTVRFHVPVIEAPSAVDLEEGDDWSLV